MPADTLYQITGCSGCFVLPKPNFFGIKLLATHCLNGLAQA